MWRTSSKCGFSFNILAFVLLFLMVNAKDVQKRQVTADGNPDIPHFKVATILGSPYSSLKRDTSQDIEGFIPDMLDALASSMRFTYTLSLVRDRKYGVCKNDSDNKTTCTGLIGEVYRQEVDIAAAPLTITRSREKHVNFVRAFQAIGISAIMQKPTSQNLEDEWPVKFNIFLPLKIEVYAAVTATALVVGLILWVMNRLNPYEWGGQRHQGLAEEEAGSRFNISGSLWFAFATLQWQGFDHGPRSVASKVLACFWFAFVTVTLVTYIGSFMNHLFWASSIPPSQPPQVPRTLRELVLSKKYDYGSVTGGSTFYLLARSNRKDKFYETIKAYWNSESGVNSLARSYHDGLSKVKNNSNYAFFLESSSAEYFVNRDCNLVEIKDVIHPRSFGLAVSHSFKYLEELHIATMELLEAGVIDRLMKKWWVEQGVCYNQTDQGEGSTSPYQLPNKVLPRRIGIEHFWAALVLMAVGILLSLITALLELIFFKFRGKYSSNEYKMSKT